MLDDLSSTYSAPDLISAIVPLEGQNENRPFGPMHKFCGPSKGLVRTKESQSPLAAEKWHSMPQVTVGRLKAIMTQR